MNRAGSEAEVRDYFGEDRKRLLRLSKRGFTLVGDVHPVSMRERSAAYTPVPGGVGPLTIAMLLNNTVTLAAARPKGRITAAGRPAPAPGGPSDEPRREIRSAAPFSG